MSLFVEKEDIFGASDRSVLTDASENRIHREMQRVEQAEKSLSEQLEQITAVWEKTQKETQQAVLSFGEPSVLHFVHWESPVCQQISEERENDCFKQLKSYLSECEVSEKAPDAAVSKEPEKAPAEEEEIIFEEAVAAREDTETDYFRQLYRFIVENGYDGVQFYRISEAKNRKVSLQDTISLEDKDLGILS